MATSRMIRPSVAVLLLAPVLQAAALLVDLSPGADSARELLGLVADAPGRWTAGQALFLLAGVAWLAAVPATRHLFSDKQRLGRLAGLLTAAGGLAMLPMDAAGLYLGPLTDGSIPFDQQVALVDDVESLPLLVALETVHVTGLFLGLLVLGVAVLRSESPARWAGVVVLAGLVGLVAAPTGAVAAAASVVLLVGLAFAVRGISSEALAVVPSTS